MSAAINARTAAEWLQQQNESANRATDLESGAVVDVVDDFILKIPVAQTPPNLVFYPGCHVMCMDYEVGIPPIVLYGVVECAALNLVTKEYVYCIQSKPYGELYIAKENTIQFAQAMPVWAHIPGIPGYSEAVVFSSQQAPNAPPTYSVTQPAVQGFHNNIPAMHIKYRGPGSIKPVYTEPEKSVEVTSTQIATQDDSFSLFGCNPFGYGAGPTAAAKVAPTNKTDNVGAADDAISRFYSEMTKPVTSVGRQVPPKETNNCDTAAYKGAPQTKADRVRERRSLLKKSKKLK